MNTCSDLVVLGRSRTEYFRRFWRRSWEQLSLALF